MDTKPEARPYGRRAFLGLVLGGVSAYVWAGPVSRLLSPVTSSFSQLGANLLPAGGWRIYTITGVMPDLDAEERAPPVWPGLRFGVHLDQT